MRVGGILIGGAEKGSGGAEGLAGHVDVECIETSASWVGGIIAAVANPGESEESDLRGLIKKWNLFRRNLQIAGLHAAVHESIKKGRKDRAPIGQLSGALFARGREGLHVARF